MIIRIGERVQLLCAPEHKGTVSGLSRGWFTVTYDWPEGQPPRRAGEPRERYRYPASAAARFGAETRDDAQPGAGEDAA